MDVVVGSTVCHWLIVLGIEDRLIYQQNFSSLSDCIFDLELCISSSLKVLFKFKWFGTKLDSSDFLKLDLVDLVDLLQLVN